MSAPAWTCSRGQPFTEFELECGMSFATMDYLTDQAERAWDLEQDTEHEAELARAFAQDPECEPPWPWYADDPVEVQEPEIIDF